MPNLSFPQCPLETTGYAPQMIFGLTQALWATKLICSLSPPDMWPRDYGKEILDKDLGRGCFPFLPFTNHFHKDFPKYDFIVIGAGTAGSVVANRLSENPKWKVLLIEAGGDPPIESEIPALALTLQKTKYDWEFYTDTDAETKSYCGAQQNKGCFWPRGKMLGGSSGIHFLMHVRGNKANFDKWSERGNTGWDYESILPYFKKSENNHNPSFVKYKNGKYHGANGPQNIASFSEDGTESIRQMVLNASIEAGHKHIDDINADESLGYLNVQGFCYNGTRQSSAKAFLIPAKDRPNLHIIKHAFVEKILIKDKKAYGVQFFYNGTKERHFNAFARKEVIVSAGAVMSPHLLMLSGIGPGKQLKKFGIPVLSNLAVGQHLIDHPLSMIWMKFNPTITSPTATLDSLLEYATSKKGAFASIGATQMTGFINSENGTGVPDFQTSMFYFTANSTPNLNLFFHVFNYNNEIQQVLLRENKNHDIAFIAVIQLNPKSRGVIELASSSPYIHPKIKPNYLSEADDLEAYLRIFKQQFSYLQTSTYKKHGGAFINLPITECDDFEQTSDDYYRCYIRYFLTSCYHPVGTCKMGPSRDHKAVVDSKLRVRNIQNLRVIDASVMPTIVSGNTNAATLMIAEKGSDCIKDSHP